MAQWKTTRPQTVRNWVLIGRKISVSGRDSPSEDYVVDICAAPGKKSQTSEEKDVKDISVEFGSDLDNGSKGSGGDNMSGKIK